MHKRKTQQFTKVMNTQTSKSPHSPACWKGWTERIFPNTCYSFCRSCAWYLGCCCCLEVQEQKNTEAVKWCMSWRTSTVRELTHKTEKEISLSLSLKATDHVAAVREKIQRCDTTKQKAAALGRAKSAPQHRSWGAELTCTSQGSLGATPSQGIPGGCPTTGDTAAELQPYPCWQMELRERLCCTQTAAHQAAASSEIRLLSSRGVLLPPEGGK